MSALSYHRQILMSQQICNAFERSTLHPQPPTESVPQIVPVKLPDLRIPRRVTEPVPPVFEWLTRSA